jgi:outer membrane protein OmpA-like peptidoglycan-associated protein
MGRPIQAPIAATLKSAGRVQVYINFVTDSSQLQSSSDKVLKELLTALQQSPELKVDLIGHTDSVGNSQHNQDLSERRAASVYLWLSQHGITRERLHSSGRGFLEPIATNDTNEGRALNRRVEVKAVN